MSGSLPTYAIVTPVRDEARHLERTARALAAQSYRPLEWVIVDDGSTDATPEIAGRFAAEHGWISVVPFPRAPAGPRARGGRVVRAFNHGRDALRTRPEITVKLDGDLYLPPHFFAWVAETFARDPRAGVVGAAVVLMPEGGRWVRDPLAEHTVAGAAKAYRTDCLDAIGGLRASMGWDGIDEYAARARGWRVHALTKLSVLHYGRRGAKQAWHRARWEEGLANHFMGYLWQWFAVRVAFQTIVGRPRLLGGMALAAGFVWAHLRSLPRVDDELAVAELRREQRARLRGLLRGRRRVPTPSLEGGGPAFWATGAPPQDAP